MSKNNNSNNGINFFTLLGLTFIILKLTGVITWSWWFVTLPLWGGIAIYLLILAGIFIAATIKVLKEEK